MNCERVLRNIDDHVDGLLPAQEAESVRDHLDTCRDCRETAAASKAASTSLAVWGDLDPPSACFDQIMAKIQALPPETLERGANRGVNRQVVPMQRRVLRWAVPSLAAAAAVVAVFVGMEQSPPRSTRIPGVGPVSASALGASPVNRRLLTNGLYPGEERIHIDPAAWRSSVRGTEPRDADGNPFMRGRALPASGTSDVLIFDQPR